MNRVHVAVAALVVAIAVALGTYTVTRSAALGPAPVSAQSANATINQTTQRLNATEAALNKALAQQPPSANGGPVPFVPPSQVVVNVSGSAGAVPYTPQSAQHFDDRGEGGD